MNNKNNQNMKKHIIKIGGAAFAALALIVAGFYAQSMFGQALTAGPNFTQATSQQPTTQTNVQIATVAITGLAPLGIGVITNVPTGIVADTNAIITCSNPFTPKVNSAAVGNVTNAIEVWGTSSNGVVYITLANLGTNIITIPASLIKVKAESWQ